MESILDAVCCVIRRLMASLFFIGISSCEASDMRGLGTFMLSLYIVPAAALANLLLLVFFFRSSKGTRWVSSFLIILVSLAWLAVGLFAGLLDYRYAQGWETQNWFAVISSGVFLSANLAAILIAVRKRRVAPRV